MTRLTFCRNVTLPEDTGLLNIKVVNSSIHHFSNLLNVLFGFTYRVVNNSNRIIVSMTILLVTSFYGSP